LFLQKTASALPPSCEKSDYQQVRTPEKNYSKKKSYSRNGIETHVLSVRIYRHANYADCRRNSYQRIGEMFLGEKKSKGRTLEMLNRFKSVRYSIQSKKLAE